MALLLTPDDYRSMPWKNGAGRTTEIAVHPAGAALDAFDWRVSIADVARDGPFSAFPGVDRTLVLLEGAGMRLAGAEDAASLTTPFVPHDFRGDEAVDCTLVAGPCRDFNAMFRRGRGHGSVAVVRGSGAPFDPKQFRLAYAAKGLHECRIAGQSAHRLAEGHALVAEPARGDEDTPIVVRPLADDAVALVVCVADR
jgi:environmental stress-induced protein Ves